MNFENIFYEENVFDFELGKYLKDKYKDANWHLIENHNNIPELRSKENKDFTKLKKLLIIGTRKTHKYVPNHKVSDFLVPYTSSGCSASCLYCYLVCNYNKCSYLRLFVNREQMMSKIIKTAKNGNNLTFEIGSNSDLVLENTITENLPWTIENFTKYEKGYITFPTKFDMVEPLLGLSHRGRVIVRMSVNPQEIITKVEFGTSNLIDRIKAINSLCDAGYTVGLLVAPVVLIENWREYYLNLFDVLSEKLSDKVKNEAFIEVIFMTYSFVHRKINNEAFPKATELYDNSIMTGRGMGKYCYKQSVRDEAEFFIRSEIERRFPKCEIIYIV